MVTGAAGFIGSHLCDTLVSTKSSSEILGIDNLSIGSIDNLSNLSEAGEFSFQKYDIVSDQAFSFTEVDLVFHLAANAEIRAGNSDRNLDFESNVVGTRNLLESLVRSKFKGVLVFASTSTVYGEAKVLPTPEDYGPLFPISIYGSSKLTCEAFISAYASLFGFKARLARFANVVGSRSNHGVITDFMRQLKKNPTKLRILGDGTQTKSYVHVSDCVNGLVQCSKVGEEQVEAFNIGTSQSTRVLDIARMVIEEMDLHNVKIETGHGDGGDGRGWAGDVKTMLLDCDKLKHYGWSCRYSSDEAVSMAARELTMAD